MSKLVFQPRPKCDGAPRSRRIGSPAGVTSASSGRNVPESGGGGSDAGSSSAVASAVASGSSSAVASAVASGSSSAVASAVASGLVLCGGLRSGSGSILCGGLRSGLRLVLCGGLRSRPPALVLCGGLRSGLRLVLCGGFRGGLCGGFGLGLGARPGSRRDPRAGAGSSAAACCGGRLLGGGLRGGDLADGLRARVGVVGAAGERQQRDGRHRRHPDGRGLPSSPRDRHARHRLAPLHRGIVAPRRLHGLPRRSLGWGTSRVRERRTRLEVGRVGAGVHRVRGAAGLHRGALGAGGRTTARTRSRGLSLVLLTVLAILHFDVGMVASDPYKTFLDDVGAPGGTRAASIVVLIVRGVFGRAGDWLRPSAPRQRRPRRRRSDTPG